MFTLILIIIILAIALATCCSMYNSERKENIEKTKNASELYDKYYKASREVNAVRMHYEELLKIEKEQTEIAKIHYRDAIRAIEQMQKDGNAEIKIIKVPVTPKKIPERLSVREYFNICGCEEWNHINHTSPEQIKKIAKAIPPISIKSYDPVTKKAEVNGLEGVYETTLTSCTCYNFIHQYTQTPCKHIYFLAKYLIKNKRNQEDEISKYVSSLTLDETNELYRQLIKK